MINRTVLVGRLTKDPELKYTQSGIAVVRFTLACNRPFKNGQGEQEADFIQCTAWRATAENVANYLSKGSLAGVDGRIQTGSFEGQDGKRVYTTEVVADSVQFLEPKKDNQQQQQSSNQNISQQTVHGNRYDRQANTQQNQNTGQGGDGGQSQQQYQPPVNDNVNSQTGNDPFRPGGGPVNVTDDDLPF